MNRCLGRLAFALAFSFSLFLEHAHALEIFSAGMEVPQSISPVPSGFGSLGQGFLVPDARFATSTEDKGRIWFVPASGGDPTLFAESRLLLRGGTFLPDDFGAYGGMYLTAGRNLAELLEFQTRQQANPNDPSLYPFEHVAQIVAYDAAANPTVVAEFKEIFNGPGDVTTPPFFPFTWITPLVVPSTFGEHAGKVVLTANEHGLVLVDELGSVSLFLSENPFESFVGNADVDLFGAAFAPADFGDAGGKLFVSDTDRLTSANGLFEIYTVTSEGSVELFSSLPISAGQIAATSGLRQMAFSPESFGELGGLLFVSVSGSFQGGGAIGELLAIDETGGVVAKLIVGTEFDKFDPRGLYFTEDGELLVSDGSDPILLATSADFVLVPEPASIAVLAIGTIVMVASQRMRRNRF